MATSAATPAQTWLWFHKSVLGRARLHRLLKNSVLHLILGGAALQRCGMCIVVNSVLAAEGTALAQKRLFPQTVQSCRNTPTMCRALAPEGNSRLLALAL